jgi:hypothetical protein
MVNLNDTHSIIFKAVIGPTSNNFMELMVLKLLFILATKYVSTIFNDVGTLCLS